MRSRLAVVGAVLLLGLGAASVHAQGAGPRFNPDTLTCDNRPPVAIARDWQVSAPRGMPGPVRPRAVVQLGLRIRGGTPNDVYYVGARVIAPDGSATTATTVLMGDEWAELLYPLDFPGAPPVDAGVYTVVWEAGGGVIACDGFVVRDD
jgi:hypothetical protein